MLVVTEGFITFISTILWICKLRHLFYWVWFLLKWLRSKWLLDDYRFLMRFLWIWLGFQLQPWNEIFDFTEFWGKKSVWKNLRVTITEKILRQINYLVMSLVNSLLSRNFCQKSVRVIFRFYHTVKMQSQYFVKSVYLHYALQLISRNFR